MENSPFNRVRIINGVVIGAFTLLGMYLHNFLMPVLAILVCAVFLYQAKTRIRATQVVEDERVFRISEKAARSTVSIFGVGAAVLGIILMTLDSTPTVHIVGMTLADSVSVMLIMFLGFNAYYSRRM